MTNPFHPSELMKFAKCSSFAFKRNMEHEYHSLGFNRVTYIEDRLTSTEAYVASNDHQLVVTFKGSKERHDWIKTNINAMKMPSNIGKLHGGFYVASQSVKSEIELCIKEHLDGKSKFKIVTGHSLGGALATIAASWHQGTLFDYCIAFGSPRAYSKRAAKEFSKLPIANRTKRIVVVGDFVTRLPKAWWGFRHIGTPLYFDNKDRLMIDPSKWDLLKEIYKDTFSEFANGELFDFEDHQLMGVYKDCISNMHKNALS